MKVICILCDNAFTPNKLQIKKIHKHPHRIQICAACYERISQQTLTKQIYSKD